MANNVTVLDKMNTNSVMAEDDNSIQTMYSLSIPANTLGVNSRLRINLTLSRIVGTPLPESDISCEPCHGSSLPGEQEISEVATLTPRSDYSGAGSFSHVGEHDGEYEIYQAVYINDSGGSGTFDNNKNLKLWRIRNGAFKRIKKVNTITVDDLNSGSLIVGVADEPVYGIYFGVSISSNAPSGLYLYFVNRRTQMACLNSELGAFNYFSVLNGSIYTANMNSLGPSLTIRQFDLSGAEVKSSSAIANAGYTRIHAFHAFNNGLYVLVDQNTVVKLDLNTLSVERTWNLGSSGFRALYVVSDNLIYLAKNHLGLYYLTTGTGVVHTLDSAVSVNTSFGGVGNIVFGNHFNLIFQKIGQNAGYFYYGTDTSNRILVIGPVNCPTE